ncbi:hypothetical protein GIB67_002820 [Kingdonia uniflora]|uniref:Lipase n=1 Tax=Kingdonia uniflora TaxID=39325 RepID=A0A7J7M5I6_9MAGN|nr:hypothetical protein GIB67_002817 [Kingdonia uniflora]KAF6150038.1 hypothetical protein GIB67_002820 [Kingdonia uniflora]
MFRCVLISLGFLVLAVEPYRAYGSTRAYVSTHDLFAEHLNDSQVSGVTQGNFCNDVISKFGYKCQEYKVKTADKYILGVSRILPSTKQAPGAGCTRTPVILQHGLMTDGNCWFLNNRNQNLPCILADRGFDVWIANTRGTRFSTGHETMSTKDKEYWDWSWDELAKYDLPAYVKFVNTQTKQKPHYIGHSQGTIIALAAFSEGKVTNMLRSASLLSPVAYLSHMLSAFDRVAAKSFLADAGMLIGLAEFDIKQFHVMNYLNLICSTNRLNCYDPITIGTGKNCCLNSSTIVEFLKNNPQPTAMKNLVHLSQTVRDDRFAKYDYGRHNHGQGNMEKYGQLTPPSYVLSKIPKSFPMFITHGGKDALSDPQDVELLKKELQSHDSDKMTVQYVPNYAHMDFIMGTNANRVVYEPLISFIKHHGN